jgi:hypothetical protein
VRVHASPLLLSSYVTGKLGLVVLDARFKCAHNFNIQKTVTK